MHIFFFSKRYSLILYFISLSLFCGEGETAFAQTEILTPTPGSTIIARNPEVHLVLRQKEGTKPEQVKLGEKDQLLSPNISIAYDGFEYNHYRLPLKNEKNKFSLSSSKKSFELFFEKIQATLKSSTLSRSNVFLFHEKKQLPMVCTSCHALNDFSVIEPIGIQRSLSCAECHKSIIEKGKFQHSSTLNLQCSACHQRTDDPDKIFLPTDNIEEICFSCHVNKEKWMSSRHKHGVISLGGCTLCHDPHSGDYENQLWAEGSLALCLTCHGDKQNLVREKDPLPYVHGIIFGEGCISCHNPHATDHQLMLKESINDLCLGCHPNLGDLKRGHPVDGHPVSGPNENLRPGRKLVCSSCHEPHGSSHQLFLIQTIAGGRLCRECHSR